VVLTYGPFALPVTVTVTMQLALATSEAPDSEIEVGAVSVIVPPQTLALAFGTDRPAGNVSVNPTPVSVVDPLGLVMLKVQPVVEPTVILVGLKDVVMTGGATTVTLAEAVPPVPPFEDVTWPVVLFLV